MCARFFSKKIRYKNRARVFFSPKVLIFPSKTHSFVDTHAIYIYTKREKDMSSQQHQEQFNSIIGRLKTAAASDAENFNTITLEEVQARLQKSRQIGFNVTASLEIEQARKRQLVETFLKHDMQLPVATASGANGEGEDSEDASPPSALEASLAASTAEQEKQQQQGTTTTTHADEDGEDEISKLKRQLATSQLDARKNLQLAKKTRAMCDKMVEMLKERGVEQLEPPRSL